MKETTVQKGVMGRPPAQCVDRYIGARIRERRMMLGLTQHELGELIGTTNQQVYKYEIGINRILAVRLYAIAQVAGVELGYFYQDMRATSTSVEQLAYQRMLLELARNFLNVPNLVHQEAICDLARVLGDQDAGLGSEAGSKAI